MRCSPLGKAAPCSCLLCTSVHVGAALCWADWFLQLRVVEIWNPFKFTAFGTLSGWRRVAWMEKRTSVKNQCLYQHLCSLRWLWQSQCWLLPCLCWLFAWLLDPSWTIRKKKPNSNLPPFSVFHKNLFLFFNFLLIGIHIYN